MPNVKLKIGLFLMKLWILIYKRINENDNPCKIFLEIFLIKVTHFVYLILENVDKNWNSILPSF